MSLVVAGKLNSHSRHSSRSAGSRQETILKLDEPAAMELDCRHASHGSRGNRLLVHAGPGDDAGECTGAYRAEKDGKKTRIRLQHHL
jgi:hypothetical protein